MQCVVYPKMQPDKYGTHSYVCYVYDIAAKL